MERQFTFVAKVRRVVVDTITVKCSGETMKDAKAKAYKVLERYPAEHSEEGVNYCYVENRRNGDAEVLSLEVFKS